MTYTDIVKKLIGPIVPIGETNEDDRRFENLKAMCSLVDDLVKAIDDVGYNANRYEYSRKRAGLFANDFLSKTLGIVE